eukprot:4198533-Ditylum_brightwellii.AAC.1
MSTHCAPSLPVPLLFTPQKRSIHKLPSQHSLLPPLFAPDHFMAHSFYICSADLVSMATLIPSLLVEITALFVPAHAEPI